MENIVGGTVMKSRELDKMDDTFADFNQGNDVGEVGCPKWVKSKCEVAPKWLEDDDDFRVVLRRPADWNESASGSDGVVPWTTQQTAQETWKKSRDRNDGKSRDWNADKSRDWSIVKTFEDKEESDNFPNGDVVKSRDRRCGLTTQQTTQRTTQQTTQDFPKKSHERNGENRSDKSKHVIVALIERFPLIKANRIWAGSRFGQWQICNRETP